MAFKLSKQERAQRDDLCARLNAARATLDEKVEDVNDAVQTAIDALEAAVASYNDVLEEARGFVADIVAQGEEDIDDKSERWQEGERGEAARAWVDEWECAQLDDVELPTIDLLEIADDDHASTLETLPDAAE